MPRFNTSASIPLAGKLPLEGSYQDCSKLAHGFTEYCKLLKLFGWEVSKDRNVRQWAYILLHSSTYEGVWGVTRLNFLLSFLLRVAVREEACELTLYSPCQEETDAALALRGAQRQHLLCRLCSLLLVQNRHCYCNRNPAKRAAKSLGCELLVTTASDQNPALYSAAQHTIRQGLC